MKNFRREDMKVVRAKDSQSAPKPSAAEQESQQQAAAQTTGQQPGQQSGQESGQPEGQTSGDETKDETSDEQSDDKEDDSSSAPSSEPITVPDGTTAEILRWVGDDKQRAQAALDKERQADKPRSGLTGELEEILGK